MPTYSLLKHIMRSLRARLTPLHLKKMINREKVSPQKMGLLVIFLDTFTKNCLVFCFVALRPSQQLWSFRNGQFRSEICLLS